MAGFGRSPRISAPAKVTISLQARTPAHVASWLGIGAPVPAIRPRQRETSTVTCRLVSSVHLLMTWPHMHRAGLEFHGSIVDGGVRIPIVDIVPWDVGVPATRSLDLDVSAGSVVETTCVWQNRTDAYVLPGRNAADEMCVQGLVGYPFEAMRCDPSGT
jgi:Copper type II ascorbate-dependent monooxygenase, C-terminal domain